MLRSPVDSRPLITPLSSRRLPQAGDRFGSEETGFERLSERVPATPFRAIVSDDHREPAMAAFDQRTPSNRVAHTDAGESRHGEFVTRGNAGQGADLSSMAAATADSQYMFSDDRAFEQRWTDIQWRTKLAEAELKVAKIEHETAQLRMETTQWKESARSMQGSPVSVSPVGSVDEAAAPSLRQQPIASAHYQDQRYSLQSQGQGQRTTLYKIGTQMKEFSRWGESSKVPISIWIRDVHEELLLKHIPEEDWSREVINLFDADAKDWYRIAQAERRSRGEPGDTPDFAELIRMLHVRYAGKYTTAALVRQKQSYPRPSGSDGRKALQDLARLQLALTAAGVPNPIGTAEQQCYDLQNALTQSERRNWIQAIDSHPDINEAAVATLVANQRRQAGGSYEVRDSAERQRIFQGQAEQLRLFLAAQGASATGAQAATLDGTTTATVVGAPNPLTTAPTDTPQSQPELTADRLETNLCAIVAGRSTREQRSLAPPTAGTKPVAFPQYFPSQPECKTEFLRRQAGKLCYACNKDKAECRSGGDVWKYAICPHHGPRVDKAGLDAAAFNGLTVRGAGGRDGRGK